MNKYKFVFTVNGRRTEQIVAASCQLDARKLIEAQYPNCKIVILSYTKI